MSELQSTIFNCLFTFTNIRVLCCEINILSNFKKKKSTYSCIVQDHEDLKLSLISKTLTLTVDRLVHTPSLRKKLACIIIHVGHSGVLT